MKKLKELWPRKTEKREYVWLLMAGMVTCTFAPRWVAITFDSLAAIVWLLQVYCDFLSQRLQTLLENPDV